MNELLVAPRRYPSQRIPWNRSPRIAGCLMAWLVIFRLSLPADEASHTATLRMLQQRHQEQIREHQLKPPQVRTSFGFQDRVVESQIRFQHRVVDDAGRSYKAAHYDHGNGVAAADVDGDGRVDLYFTTQMGTNQLWRNLGQGRFEDITAKSGTGLVHSMSVGAAFADIDNDGDPDLFVTTTRHGNHLFLNQGKGQFIDATESMGLRYSGHSSSAVFFDYDGDSWLDLLLVNVGRFTTEQIGPGGYYISHTNAFQGHLFPERNEASILYHNRGGKRFVDVSGKTGLVDVSWSGDACQVDLNEDGFPDLYLTNMQGDDHYYENQGGKRFVDRTASLFPKTPWGAMQPRFFDYNLDGRMDLFVTDMHSDMTQGQTEKALNFASSLERAKSEMFCSVQWTEEYLQGSTNNLFGNAFYRNEGGGKFSEISDALEVETYWPWGNSVGDFNADGYEDLFVTAGMGYPFRYAVNSLLLNDQAQRFVPSEFMVGIEPRGDRRTEKNWFIVDCDGADKDHPECAGKSGWVTVTGTLSSRSSVVFDLDQDGDLDIVTSELNYRSQVLINNLSEKHQLNTLQLRLVGRKGNRDALGAWVKVTAGNKTQTRYHDGKSGYLAQSSLPLYFGLGQASAADRIEITWPGGGKQVLIGPIAGNQILRLEEGGSPTTAKP